MPPMVSTGPSAVYCTPSTRPRVKVCTPTAVSPLVTSTA
jgi:hypothetical protein